MKRKALALLGTWVLAVTGFLAVTVQSGTTLPPSPFPALPNQQLAGYSTGTDVHVGLLQAGALQLAHAEAAFSGASVASQGSNTRPAFGPGVGATPGEIVNEMGQVVQPPLPGGVDPQNPAPDPLLTGNKSFGRGSALEVGLGNPIPNDKSDVILPGRTQASAPPDHVPTTPHSAVPPDNCLAADPLCKQVLAVPAAPLAYAQVLQNEAAARWDGNVNNCIVGAPYSEGQAHAADVQLLDTANPSPATNPLTAPLLTTNAPASGRSAAQSWSNERLVNQTLPDGTPLPTTNGNLGLMSETRETIAPVSLAWTPAVTDPVTHAVLIPAHPAVTIEVLGEWVLQAIAGGLHGSAYVHYGPDPATTNNSTPVLRVTTYNPATGLPDPNPSQLTFQQVLGNNGLLVNVPPSPTTGPFVLQLHIATAPHQIGDPSGSLPKQEDTADGQFAAAAVDVLRVAVLNIPGPGVNPPPAATNQVADLRLGHMESLAQIGAGGINCPLDVAKTSSAPTVAPGDTFQYTISVGNPYDCDLTALHLVDTLTADPGVKYTVTSPTNGGAIAVNSPSSSPTSITWDNLGAVPAHSPPGPVATVTVHVDPTSGGGFFHDTVVATGPCAGRASNNLPALVGPSNTVNLNGTAQIDAPQVVVPGAPVVTTTTTTTTPGATTTTTTPGATTTTTTPGATPTTTTPGATTTTAPGVTPGGATTTTTSGGNNNTTNNNTTNNNTTNNNATNNNATTTTTAAPQVLATTFSQTPAAQAQSQTPNFTG
jgi:hypothetical protein